LSVPDEGYYRNEFVLIKLDINVFIITSVYHTGS